MSLNDERILARLEHSWLEPPAYEEPKCECGSWAKYQIGDDFYCEDCIDQFHTDVLPFDSEYCEYCGEEEVDEGYLIDGDFYCKECFPKAFGI